MKTSFGPATPRPHSPSPCSALPSRPPGPCQASAPALAALPSVKVFDGRLPVGLPLVWNPRLTATAGQVVDDGSVNALKSSAAERVPVRLELSSKVVDCEARLRSTLAHEMCHVAAWALSKEYHPHHGQAFWGWAQRCERLMMMCTRA